jgi:hypothetical protein
MTDLLAWRTAVTLVFRSGSNCSENEMNSKTRLRGEYELACDVQSSGRGCATVTWARKAGGKVWGVLQ